jgi:hypothetical protein
MKINLSVDSDYNFQFMQTIATILKVELPAQFTDKYYTKETFNRNGLQKLLLYQVKVSSALILFRIRKFLVTGFRLRKIYVFWMLLFNVGTQSERVYVEVIM